MRQFVTAISAAVLTATSASAGGVDRSGQSTNVLFEDGRHLEFSLARIDPDLSGYWDYALAGYPKSKDIAPAYVFGSAAYKADLSPSLAYAVILDQPYGADVKYPSGTNYYAQGSEAKLRSTALTALLKHTSDNNLSVFGGIRVETMKASAKLPGVGGYAVDGSQDVKAGYVLGAAWEKPDIAARVSLTYSSAIHFELDTNETGAIVPGGNLDSKTKITAPQSVNLAFQTGIAADTLLFGSVRWVEWSKFVIEPKAYTAFTGSPIVAFSDDRVTYNLGLGRKLNETWAIAGTVGYEATLGGISSNLAPSDGARTVGFGVTRTAGNTKITAGLSYIWIGHATTSGPSSTNGIWEDNTGVAAAIKVAFTL